MEYAQSNHGLDDFSNCIDPGLRQELQLKMIVPATSGQTALIAEYDDNSVPSTFGQKARRRADSHGPSESVSLGDRVVLAWINSMSQEV